MNNILRIVVAAVAASLLLAWVAPALAQSPAARVYRSLQVIAPEVGATLHDNAGDVEVVVSIDPALDTAAGHRLAVSVDGSTLPLRSTSARFIVPGIERGEHVLRVLVVAADGTSLMRSDARTINVWRASRLFPSRRQPAS